MIERTDVVVVGGSVAGLFTGHRLRQRNAHFLILEASPRVGDAWRDRYDSLRLFSYRRAASLPGLAMPIGMRECPTADQFADYLEGYARHFRLPVRTDTRVERVSPADGGFRIDVLGPDGPGTILAGAVIVAAGAHRTAVLPAFADRIDPVIRQLHSIDYRSPADLAPGAVLVVGAGNSGTDVALEAARAGHATVLAGRHPGQTPFRLDSLGGFLGAQVFLFALRHLTVRTGPGRATRDRLQGHGLMLIRNKLADLDAAGVRRVGRVTGVVEGRPSIDGGKSVAPATVVWCTGSRPELAWLELEGALNERGEPVQSEGVATAIPGLGFVGLDFQYSAASATIQGMDRDARAVLNAVLRSLAPTPVAA